MDLRNAIIWYDDQVLVINKPPGLLTIPDGYDPRLPHVAGLLVSTFGQTWIVHRLDRDTSGILILARNPEAHKLLNAQFQDRTVNKIYHAIVAGHPDWTEREVDLPLLVDGDRRHRTVVDSQKGKPATTNVILLERLGRYCLVEAHPHSGYTHQIRVHLANVGCPIIADPVYGDGKPLLLSSLKPNYRPSASPESPLIERTALHAWRISFIHPTGNTSIDLEAPYPKDFATALKHLRKHG